MISGVVNIGRRVIQYEDKWLSAWLKQKALRPNLSAEERKEREERGERR
jgi:hypothetical protein